jgi:hypothetical protein
MPRTHRVKTGQRVRHAHLWHWWECSCGRSGSISEGVRDVRSVSDEHIDRAAGDKRIDVREATT